MIDGAAIACDLGAELLHAGGRDGLALTAKATAQLLHLTAILGRNDG